MNLAFNGRQRIAIAFWSTNLAIAAGIVAFALR
jgi:hypothetical protein